MFKSIQLETIPSDSSETDFVLDDIITCDSDDKLISYQIKHVEDVDKKWTLAELLKVPRPTRNGKQRKSLLNRWVNSFLSASSIAGGFFITNKNCREDFLEKLVDGRIDRDRILNCQSTESLEFRALFPDTTTLDRFLERFSFQFGALSKEDLERSIYERASTKLGLTREGWFSLKVAIHQELSRTPETHVITLENLRRWGQWDTPRPLNQEFEIPADFVLFDRAIHQKIRQQVFGSTNFTVITGGPGSGKSTYISYLQKLLKRAGLIVLRHHYYISEQDSERGERLLTERVLEALRAQILEYRAQLGSLEGRISSSVPLVEYLKQLGNLAQEKKQKVIFIIDGLDHPLRENQSSELQDLLQQALPFQTGIHVILGTQPHVIDLLPATLKSQLDNDSRIEVPPLTVHGIGRILLKNANSFDLPSHEQSWNAVLQSLLQLTEGNPLHLRYSLLQLANQGESRAINDYLIKELVPFGASIRTYYDQLWHQLDEDAKNICLLVQVAPFPLTKRELLEAIHENSSSDLVGFDSLRSVSHLLRTSIRGLSIFHNSFGLYLDDSEELKSASNLILKLLGQWLDTKGSPELRKMYLPCIKAELGDSDSLRTMDRQWVVNNLLRCWSPKDIEQRLNQAIRLTRADGPLQTNCFLSHLVVHLYNTCQFNEGNLGRLYSFAAKISPPNLRYLNFPQMPHAALAEIALSAALQQRWQVVDEIFKALRNRPGETRQRLGSDDDHVPDEYYTAKVYSLLPRTTPEMLVNLVDDFSQYDWDDALRKCFLNTQRLLGKTDSVQAILHTLADSKKQTSILLELIIPEIATRISRFYSFLQGERWASTCPLVWLYGWMNGVRGQALPPLPQHREFREPKDSFDIRDYTIWTEYFLNSLLYGIVYSLADKEDSIDEWRTATNQTWLHSTIVALMQIGCLAGKALKNRSRISLEDILQPFGEIRPLTVLYDRAIQGFQSRLRQAISLATALFQAINISKGFQAELSANEALVLQTTPVLGDEALLEVATEGTLSRPILNQTSHDALLGRIENKLGNQIETFPERTSHYLRLVDLCVRQLDRLNASRLLNAAAENFLAYGEHKDLFYSELLNAIEESVKFLEFTGISQLRNLIPRFERVGDFTDGDETRHLPSRLADLVADEAPKMLGGLYVSSLKRGDLDLAELTFVHLLKSWSFDSAEQVAVAMTSLEDDTYDFLRENASSIPNIRSALNSIDTFFGTRTKPLPEVKESSDTSNQTIDFASILPSQIDDLLTKESDSFQARTLLRDWMRFWLAERPLRDSLWESAYRRAVAEVKDTGIEKADGDLLDLIYPAALTIEPNNCFSYLCHANERNFGWSHYWQSDEKRLKRWAFVKDHFPDRYLEFLHFKKERNQAGNGWYRNIQVPFPLGIHYLLFFNDQPNAFIALNVAIDFAISLTANLALPQADWLDSNNSALDILFVRAQHPLPLIRERAVTALSWLYANSEESREQICSTYQSLISSCRLETEAIELLLGLYRLCKDNQSSIQSTTVHEIVKDLRVNCFVINEIMQELSRVITFSVPPLHATKQDRVESEPDRFRCDRTVSDIAHSPAKTFLGLLGQLEEQHGEQVRQDLCCFIEETKNQGSLPFGTFSSTDWRRSDGAFAKFASPPEYHAYVSAFIRLIEQYFQEKKITELTYRIWSLKTSPLDLSLWDKSPGRAPDWWVRSNRNSTSISSIKDLTAHTDIDQRITPLLGDKDGWTLLGLKGAVPTNHGWIYRDLFVDITVLAFAYKIEGATIPKAEEVWDQLRSKEGVVFIPESPRPLRITDSSSLFYSLGNATYEIEDLFLAPLVAPYRIQIGAAWQWNRPAFFFGLKPNFVHHFKLSLGDNGWCWTGSDQQPIVTTTDFCEGIDCYAYHDRVPPSGQFTRIRTSVLDQFLKENSLRLGYLQIIEESVPKSRDDYESVEMVKFLSVSNIIL